jgi:hypothetical protein
VTLEFLCDLLALLEVGVLQSRLNDTDGIVLENKIPDSPVDDLKKLGNEFLPLLERDVGLATQTFPQLL